MKMWKKAVGVLLTAVMVLSAVSVPAGAKSAEKLNKTDVSLAVGESVSLKVTGTKQKATWSSSDKSVAAVTKSGKVTAKKTGKATVSAKLKKKTLKCKVTVIATPESGVVMDVASPEWVTKLPAAQTATSLVVVTAENETDRGAWFSYHEKKADGTWLMQVSTPCFIGKNGLGKTKEGDLKTPVGTFHFTCAFGNDDDPGCKMPYVKATEYTYWSGDPDCMYNQMIEDCRKYPDLNLELCDEHIVDYPIHYQYGLNISYNEEGTPGLGSAIFLHCLSTGKPWTGGCIGIPFNRMQYIMTRVDGNTQIVIDTIDNLGGEWPAAIL